MDNNHRATVPAIAGDQRVEIAEPNGMTPRQRFVLEWLGSNHQSRSRWMRNGKDAYGPPEKWDALEISGKDGSVIIAASDWQALRDHVEFAPPESNRMFQPRAAISKAEPR